MKIDIRRATPKDAPMIAEYNYALAEETEGILLDRKRLLRGVTHLLKDRAKGFYVLAVVDGNVAGQLMITFEWSDWRCATFWWIQSVYVAPALRGRGVFTRLYRSIEREAKKNKSVCGLRLYVDHDNAHAQRRYETLGMNKAQYRMNEVDFVIDRTPAQ